jgi:hypothetical protein
MFMSFAIDQNHVGFNQNHIGFFQVGKNSRYSKKYERGIPEEISE